MSEVGGGSRIPGRSTQVHQIESIVYVHESKIQLLSTVSA